MLVGGDAADTAKAKGRALNTLPVVIGFAVGCALGAAGEAAVGLWSLMLPTALALFSCIIGMGRGADIRQLNKGRPQHGCHCTGGGLRRRSDLDRVVEPSKIVKPYVTTAAA